MAEDTDTIDTDTEEKPPIKLISLSKPPSDLEDVDAQFEETESRFKRRAIELDELEKSKLERDLYDKIIDWQDSRSSLQQKLKELNDLAEGVEKITNFPWSGASSVHIPIPKIKLREIHSVINRTLFRPVPFLMARYAGPNELFEESSPVVKDIEDFVEDKIKNDTNVHRVLKESISPLIRDGTVVPQIIWETDFERVTDYKIYANPADFVADYPTADDAGLSEKKYDDILERLSSGQKHEIQYEYDCPVYDGPKGYLVPLIDFVHWPVYVTSIPDMLLHGKRIYWTDHHLEEMHRIGKFPNEDDVDFVIKSQGDLREDDGLTQSRDQIEGIDRNRFKSNEHEGYELIYKVDLDEDGVKEKYLISFALRTMKILRIEKYPIRKGKSNYFPTRILKRDGRFLGMSLLDDIASISAEIDIIHRQRINSRTISHVPTFKAKTTIKDLFNPAREDLKFIPGRVYYLPDPDNDVKQFDIRPVDLSGSVDEENLLFMLCDLVTGASSGLSGQSNPLDPRAPARKQQELLRQSTNRIDDYVEPLVDVLSEIGQFFIDLYYQYAPDRIKYYVRNEAGNLIQKEIDRAALYNPNLRFVINGTSVFLNPDAEYSRNQEIAAILGTNVVTAQNPRIQSNMMKRLLISGRVKDEKDLLPTKEEVSLLTGGAEIVPSDQEKELATKQKIQQEKIASRLSEGEARRKQEAEMALLETAQMLSEMPAPVTNGAPVPGGPILAGPVPGGPVPGGPVPGGPGGPGAP